MRTDLIKLLTAPLDAMKSKISAYLLPYHRFNCMSATSTFDRYRPLMFWGALLGGFAVFCTVALLFAAVRWVSNELAKADPIPGITIVVDTGNAVDAKGIEHAAHAYLNRRLREAGFDEPGLDPLRIEVQFVKVGTVEYVDVDKKVAADKVRVDVKFHDAAGKHLKTISAEPKMDTKEEFKYDAENSLNKTVYSRAVSEIRRMNLPSPAELR